MAKSAFSTTRSSSPSSDAPSADSELRTSSKIVANMVVKGQVPSGGSKLWLLKDGSDGYVPDASTSTAVLTSYIGVRNVCANDSEERLSCSAVCMVCHPE